MPPSNYKRIDTLVQSRKEMAFSSHRLEDLAYTLNNRHKIKTEFDLWRRCAGNTSLDDQMDALNQMVKYNKQDILVLEDYYVELRPWIQSHPNLALYMETDKPVCGSCGSTNIKHEGKFYYTTVSKFKSFRCNDCGSQSRERQNILTKEERKQLLVPLAR
jgi:hypothetical protein